MKKIFLILITLGFSQVSLASGGGGDRPESVVVKDNQISDQVSMARFVGFQEEQPQSVPVINSKWVCTAEGYDYTSSPSGIWETLREFGATADEASYNAQRSCFLLGLSECTLVGCLEQK